MAKRRRKTKKAEVQAVRRPVVDRLLDTLPVIAPIPTAWAIGAAMTERLGWPLGIVAIAAAAIEASGFVSADTASKYYEFNRTAKVGETKAPAWIAYFSLGLYLAVTLTMTFMYEPMAAIFPGLSAVGFLLFVLRKDQQARETDRQATRKAKQVEKQAKKDEKKLASNSASKPGKSAKVAPQVARKAIPDDALLAYLASNPGESHQQVADHFGVSRQAIGQRVKKLYEVKQ